MSKLQLNILNRRIIRSLFGASLFACLTLILGVRYASADCSYTPKPFPAIKGNLEKSFKVLTSNIWGQHIGGFGDFIWPPPPFNDGSCQDRLREIGIHIRDAQPRYDIVGIQEWHPDTSLTCNGEVLRNRIDDRYAGPTSTGFFEPEQGFEWSQYRWGHPEAYDQKDGGLGLISETPFLWEKYDEDDFGTIWEWADGHPVETINVHQFHPRLMPRTAHGFIFARIYLRYPDIAIDTYVVHLNSTGEDHWYTFDNTCDLKCKKFMLRQLREGIHQRSADSGFPVLVMGDFNIGGPNPSNGPECAGSDGYADIMKSLGDPRDLWLEARPNEDGTTVNWDDDPKRIDFIFVPDDPYLVNSAHEILIESPPVSNVKIHDWNGNSDHHGLIANLELRQKVEEGQDHPTQSQMLLNAFLTIIN